MLTDGDYIVRTINFPISTLDGFTILDHNGFYNIYINNRVCVDRQLQAYNHERKHIELGHFLSNKPVWLKELEANA